ncbi:hypothetical protein HYU96_02955 [Candidatus Daviesbacteria bacterium]|nr:hypothetical protein [Candidatus Daviesbacteria bacterium]
MNKKIIIIIFIIIIAIILFIILKPEKAEKSLVNPQTQTFEQTPTPTPKTFQFDASTDLGKELDSVNPEVLDSDFNE